MSVFHIPVFHITHVENLPSIIQDDCLWCDHEQRNRGARQQKIGYEHIKERRLKHPVGVAKRGTLGNYVPFYFAPRSVMLYVIHKGHENYKGGQELILHLVSSVTTIANYNSACFFTDRHADLGYAQQVDDLARLDSIVDFHAMKEKYWGSNHEIKEKRQAEFLVHNSCPWSAIEAIGVHNSEIASKVQKALENAKHKPQIIIRPTWYYGRKKSCSS